MSKRRKYADVLPVLAQKKSIYSIYVSVHESSGETLKMRKLI